MEDKLSVYNTNIKLCNCVPHLPAGYRDCEVRRMGDEFQGGWHLSVQRVKVQVYPGSCSIVNRFEPPLVLCLCTTLS